MSSLLSTIKTQGIRPKKSMGQNFLIDNNIVKNMLKAGNIGSNDVVVEIGPGMGALTQELALISKKVIAIEKDEKLAKNLENIKNVKVIAGDALEEITKIKGDYKVVANVPYYLTSFLIRTMLESDNPPKDIVLLIQKEVAQRICSKQNNLLSISVNYYAKPEITGYVSKNCFFPKPKVDGAIIKITPINRKKNDNFFKLVKLGYSHPRKILASNLKGDREIIEKFLKENGFSLKARAEELNVDDWIKLSLFVQREKS
jgi:16S rRNA (adenine1518-N6/adenine1519-N6)-dimethyltransferase